MVCLLCAYEAIIRHVLALLMDIHCKIKNSLKACNINRFKGVSGGYILYWQRERESQPQPANEAAAKALLFCVPMVCLYGND